MYIMDSKKKITLWKLVPENYELDFQEIYNKVVEDLGSDTNQDLIGNHFCDNTENYLKDLYDINFDELNQDVSDEISDSFLDWLCDIVENYEENKI